MSREYHISELEKLGVSGLQITYASLAADTASVDFAAASATSRPHGWHEGERIILTDTFGGERRRVYNGRVKSIGVSLSGGSYTDNVEIAGDVDILESVPLAKLVNGTFVYGQFFSMSHDKKPNEKKVIPAGEVLTQCFAWAHDWSGSVMDCGLHVTFAASSIMAVVGSGGESCFSLARTAMKWVPNAYSCMSYSDAGDLLTFAQAGDLPAYTIDAARHTVTQTREIELSPAARATARVTLPENPCACTVAIGADTKTVEGGATLRATLAAIVRAFSGYIPVRVESDGADTLLFTGRNIGAAINGTEVSVRYSRLVHDNGTHASASLFFAEGITAPGTSFRIGAEVFTDSVGEYDQGFADSLAASKNYGLMGTSHIGQRAIRLDFYALRAGAWANGIPIELVNNPCNAMLLSTTLEGGRDPEDRCTPVETPITAQLAGGADRATETITEVVGTFGGVTSVSLRARHDLVPPVCALTGKVHAVLPQGGDIRTPGSYVYNLPKDDVEGESGGGEMDDETRRAVQDAAAPKMEVIGWEIPEAWKLDQTEMLHAVKEVEKYIKFWGAFSKFKVLKKLAAVVRFGGMRVEIVDAEDAYEEEEDIIIPAPGESESDVKKIPYNYDPPKSEKDENWEKLYVHQEGSFPASRRRKKCLSGLKFCKASIYQNVVLVGKIPAGVMTMERALEFFDGHKPFTDDVSSTAKPRRYTCLRLDCTLINRRKKRYKTGTNELCEDDQDYKPEENSGGAEGDKDREKGEYIDFLNSYYAATRKLYYDGTVTLTRVDFDPAALCAHGINIAGLDPEWETMESPCVQAVYDAFERRLSLTLGSREPLTIDEMADRSQAIKEQAMSGSIAAQNSEDDGKDFNDDPNPENPENPDKNDDLEMIAPNHTASHSSELKGRALEPFEVYPEGDRWYINEGELASPQGAINFPKTEITSIYKDGHKYIVVPKYDKKNKIWKPQVRYGPNVKK